MRINSNLFLAFILGFSLLACNNAKKQESKTSINSENWNLKEAAKPFAGETITLIGEDYAPLNAIKKIKGEFEKETGIKVKIEGYEAEIVQQKINLDINSKVGQYDIIIQVYFDMGRLVTRKQVMPLSPFLNDESLHNPKLSFKNDFFDCWESMGTYNNEFYGFPLMVLTMYTWYRKDLLNSTTEKRNFETHYGYELAPPTNWQEYKDISEFFNRPNDGLYGTLIQGKKHIALWQEYINFLYSFGGAILDTKDPSEYGDIVINSPTAIEATNYYKSLMKYSSPDALNFTWDDALALNQQGKVAISIMWTDQTYAIEDSTQSKVAGKMGYTMLPKKQDLDYTHQIGGQSLYIPVTSKHPEAAYLFLEWLMLPENQIKQQKLGGASPRKSTYQDSEVKNLPWTEASINALNNTHPAMLYTFPESMQIGEIIKEEISKILSNQISTEDGLNQAAVKIKAILGNKANQKYPVK
jgi:multiple sugar transport system substrate-binding protein